jgi:hypothetical protein
MARGTDTLYIGIDPGKTGAIAAIDSNRELLSLYDWPPSDSPAEVYQIIRKVTAARGHVLACIEQVSSMPSDGRVSAFSFGKNFGIWLGELAALQIPYKTVRPNIWQKGIPKGGDKKSMTEARLRAAIALFPRAYNQLIGPRGGVKSGRVDALLIAEWALRQYAKE